MSRESDDGGFLQRWSRLKQEARSEDAAPRAPAAPVPQPPEQQQAPDVPPIASLTLDSDYKAFFHPRIEEGLRRAALKKLFSDPHFNVMDGLDVYIDDYSKSDPLPGAMLEQLEQAKKILAWSREDAEQREKDAARVAGAPSLPDSARPDAIAASSDDRDTMRGAHAVDAELQPARAADTAPELPPE